jgi:hypothetical protein
MLNAPEAPVRLIGQRFLSSWTAHPSLRNWLNARIAALPANDQTGEKVMLSLSEVAIAAGLPSPPYGESSQAGFRPPVP